MNYPNKMLAATELAHRLRNDLLRLADRTHGQLVDLHRDTTGERAFNAASAVHEVWVLLMRLGTELDRRS